MSIYVATPWITLRTTLFAMTRRTGGPLCAVDVCSCGRIAHLRLVRRCATVNANAQAVLVQFAVLFEPFRQFADESQMRRLHATAHGRRVGAWRVREFAVPPRVAGEEAHGGTASN